MARFEGVDRHIAPFALGDKPLGAIESCEIVQHSGQPRACGVFAVLLREPVREPRDAHGMRVAIVLTDLRADLARERRKRTIGGRARHRL